MIKKKKKFIKINLFHDSDRKEVEDIIIFEANHLIISTKNNKEVQSIKELVDTDPYRCIKKILVDNTGFVINKAFKHPDESIVMEDIFNISNLKDFKISTKLDLLKKELFSRKEIRFFCNGWSRM